MKSLSFTLLFFIFLLACKSNSADENFIGNWRYSEANNENGQSSGMQYAVTTIKKMEGSRETYLFNFLNWELIFRKTDNKTLQGELEQFMLKYDEKTSRLYFVMDSTKAIIFEKLK